MAEVTGKCNGKQPSHFIKPHFHCRDRIKDTEKIYIILELSDSESYSSSERKASSDTDERLLTCHGNYNTRT